VAEYLLEHGADVNAQDKGGLIPLHNAASYGVSFNKIYTKHYLIKYRLRGDWKLPFLGGGGICIVLVD